MKNALLLFALIFISVTSMASQRESKVIYGEDDRLEIHQSTAYWQRKADSTVALMFDMDVTDLGNGNMRISGDNYGTSYSLCTDEPFREQSSAAFCSGSLVTPNVIMTAGHCVRSQTACDRNKFVFGFGYNYSGKNLTEVPALDVYGCKKLLVRKEESYGADYALIELDRAVIGHEPLEYRKQGVVSKGDALVVIGHPAGIPTKVAGGSNVREVKEEGYFVANLDTYGGNSGSAVFSETTGLIEGILVRGAPDFIYQNGCRKSNVCPNEGCNGEEVTRIDAVVQFIPAF